MNILDPIFLSHVVSTIFTGDLPEGEVSISEWSDWRFESYYEIFFTFDGKTN